MHPWAFAQETCAEGAKSTGERGITPAFPAQWFTAYFALSPVNQLDCHRRFAPFARNLAPAWARQDHTTSLVRDLRCSSVCAFASTASRPARRDDRDAPLSPRRDIDQIPKIGIL